jgi:hypothetical protein
MDEALEVDMCFRDGAVAAVGQVNLLREPRAMAAGRTDAMRAAARIIAHPHHVSIQIAPDSKRSGAVL